MVGPLVVQELVLDGRRNRQHVLRWLYAGWLLVQWCGLLLVFLVVNTTGRGRSFHYSDFAGFSHAFLETFVAQHFLILLLATPTLVAGSITDEKSRGTLQYLLIADLDPWEIVAGKLLGRAYHVLLLLLPGLPLVCFLGVFGGLDLAMLLAFVVATLLVLFGVGSASVLASVICRHTRDAVLGLYALLAGFYLAGLALRLVGGPGWILAVLAWCDPLHPLGDVWAQGDIGELGRRILMMTLWWGCVGLACLALASGLLKRAYLRYLEGEKPKKQRWWRAARPAVGVNPLHWKERHVEGIAPLAVLRTLPRWLGLLLVGLATIGSSSAILVYHLPQGIGLGHVLKLLGGFEWAELASIWNAMTPSGWAFFVQAIVVLLLATFVVGIRCSGLITGERERKTWEALLLTPLETRQLVRGKLWGILGACLPYLVAYALPALALSALGKTSAFLWTLLWLGVTILAIAYVASAGIWCSVRAKSSWRSLLATLGFTYLGGIVLYCLLMPVIMAVWAVIAIVAMFLQQALGVSFAGIFSGWWDGHYVAVCVALAGGFVFLSWRLLVSAEYRIGILERIKHWKNEPRRPGRSPRRRRPSGRGRRV